jgi:stage V sporulation protein R
MMSKPLYEPKSDWSFDLISKIYDACEEIAINELGCDCYINQLEVVTFEQMLDAYASIGMPLSYNHWSNGKAWAHYENQYRKGRTSLAYELVINSNPCINYLMEENSMTTQTLVIAHAAFGHNHFFKNNYLFKTWTSADSIIDYLLFAKNYIQKCEEKYGLDEVELFLDSLHAIRNYGINKYKRPDKLNVTVEAEKAQERATYLRKQVNELWDTTVIPNKKNTEEKEQRVSMAKPEENIIYFLEKHAPNLTDWQRELCRIVRKIAQYFYPQGQTKVMNEGFACFVHYYSMNRLHEKGLITDAAMFEFLRLHTNVLNQPTFDKKWYNGMNPYSLGFAMFMDIKRMCEHPTAEDKEWFPDIAGGDWKEIILDAVANYRDESFILQFLSPKVIRDFRLFQLGDNKSDPHYKVKAIHNDKGYKSIRKEMARQYDYNYRIPDIQVVDYDHDEKRSLLLHHYKGPSQRELSKDTTIEVLNYIAYIWGYEIQLDVYSKQEKFIDGESVGDPFQKVNGYKSTSTDGTSPPPEKVPAKNFGYWGMCLTSDNSETIDKS